MFTRSLFPAPVAVHFDFLTAFFRAVSSSYVPEAGRAKRFRAEAIKLV
jgi:hypothetical protein